MGSNFKIGVDGGGTKTECILVDERGEIVARHLAPASNPSVVGTEQARLVVTDALFGLMNSAFGPRSGSSATHPAALMVETHLYMAGSPIFWRDFARTLEGFGRVIAADDSLPVLELATGGEPGLVLHSGTGSFVAARAPDGSIHYAGGLGWRFGDPGSGYELGRRAIARALLELQGWAPPTRLAAVVRDATQLGESADAAACTRFFYQHAEPNRQVAALAPAVLRLAAEDDPTAKQLVVDSVSDLFSVAARVAATLFPNTAADRIHAGLSGPILTHPVVLAALTPRSPLALQPVVGSAIDGVRQLITRGTAG